MFLLIKGSSINILPLIKISNLEGMLPYKFFKIKKMMLFIGDRKQESLQYIKVR